MILSMLDAPRGGIQILFGHQKQQSPPLAVIQIPSAIGMSEWKKLDLYEMVKPKNKIGLF